MIFADHIKGLDNRIEFQRLRAWNATEAETKPYYVANKHSMSIGLLRYDTTNDEFSGFVGEASANDDFYDKGYTWAKLMDDRLQPGMIWYGEVVDRSTTPNWDKVNRAVPTLLSDFTLDFWSPPVKNVDIGNYRIVNVSVPVDDSDAVNKKYVGDQIKSGGERQMPAARVATTTKLDGTYALGVLIAPTNTPLPPIDGVTDLKKDDLVLVMNQGTPIPGHQSTKDIHNGLYQIVATSPKWQLRRHVDMDYGNGDETAAGKVNEFNNASVVVREGNTHANSTWRQVTPFPIKDRDPIEFRSSVSGAHYTAGNGMVLAGHNTFHFCQSTDYTGGSLFRAKGAHAVEQVLPGGVNPSTNSTTSYVPFVHQDKNKTRFQKSEWSLPVTLASNSILVANGASPIQLTQLAAPTNRVLVRMNTGGIVWSNKLPTGVGMPDLVPLDKGGTGADLTTGDNASIVATDKPNVRHGVVFRMDGSATPDQLEITDGPPVDGNMLLMHEAQKGASLGTAINQGKQAWKWIDLWKQPNHFEGELKLGPKGNTALACEPVLILENMVGTPTTTNTSSPAIQWVAKWTSTTAHQVGWSALVRMNDNKGSTSWELGRCDSSKNYHAALELNSAGLLKLTNTYDASGSSTAFLQVSGSSTGKDTIGPGSNGLSSLTFVTNHVNGQHSDVLWKLAPAPPTPAGALPTVTLSGTTTTDLLWGGEPISTAKGGWGMDVSGLTANEMVIKTGTNNWSTIHRGTVDYAPLLNRTTTIPSYATYALPSRLVSSDVGGFLHVKSTRQVDVLHPISGEGIGITRKFVKNVVFTTATATISHTLNTKNVVVSVRELDVTKGAKDEQVYVTVHLTTNSIITLELANAPTSAHTYVVTVVG